MVVYDDALVVLGVVLQIDLDVAASLSSRF